MRLWRLDRHLFAVLIGGYLFCYLIAQAPKIFDYYRVSDDLRQQVYPLYLARDPELFKDDLLTRYFMSHTPPFYYWAHYPLAWLIDPVILSKISQFGLLALVLFFLFRIGRRLAGPFLGWTLVFLTVHSSALVGMTDGGLPRAWAVPGLVVFSWAVLESRPKIALAAVVVSGVFYPPIFLVLGPSYGVWTMWRRAWSWWDAAALVVLAAGFWPMLFRGEEIGHIVTYAQAAKMPEWQAGSRFPFIPTPSLQSLFPRDFVISYLPAELYSKSAWLLVAAGLCAFAFAPERSQQGKERAPSRLDFLAACGLPLVFSILMYVVSTRLAFRLHIPDRNLKYTIPILGVILISVTLFRAFSLLGSRLSGAARAAGWGGWPATVAILFAFLLGGTGFKSKLNLWADEGWARYMFAFVETLPKDATLAGPLTSMDDIPLFARRKVYVSDEAVQPLYDRYYSQISVRVRRTYAAYYATDLETVDRFRRETGVGYMLVKRSDFTHEFKRARYYWPPYNDYIIALKGDRPNSAFVFARPPRQAILYEDRDFQIVDLAALVSAASETGEEAQPKGGHA
jgi:hypothetical protein